MHTVYLVLYLLMSTFMLCVMWFMVYVFLTEFLPKCYALHLRAFDRHIHTLKAYLLTYLCTTVCIC